MRFYFYIIAFFIFFHVSAQKQIQKTWDAKSISTLIISGNTMFKIEVETKPIATINMQLDIEGEHHEQIVLQSHTNQDTLFIGSTYQPMFTKPDDKLSAHKQISIELSLKVPEDMNLDIKSDIASVFLAGDFNQVRVELINGHFSGNLFSNTTLVNTLQGDIHVETDQVQVEMNSKNGKVSSETLRFGKNQMTLHSINGNISVTKTQ